MVPPNSEDFDTQIEPASYLLDAVTRVHRATVHIGNLRLASWDLTLPSYSAMRVIAAHPELSLGQLSRRCFVRPQTMTRIVTQLESRGYVARRSRPSDARAIALDITVEGRALLAEVDPTVRQINTTIQDLLGNKEIESIDAQLRRCVDALEGGIAEGWPESAL
ncbi:MAG: MarR family transcriptional regulator [Actinomycetota bacterium]|nr:MarR family transcriptional regulator [Actinomycetota bacterium]